ncbi:MurR/RpiR family transcriptional regulator [Nocardia sp. NBC_00565]|uniref:MurR/RpiR family transcriptional regulator n=1 Tax=Nocardia sp. NBC_00565 TaxID=2975993 RepID=UPI002E801F49|nr:MurR/RpiR family transcriptional regulator [Nocardia sp. NBC_00565]WUC06066.1 MurR/RpiR family transcriptional regulator [Nocardia sp. NBC_00565]
MPEGDDVRTRLLAALPRLTPTALRVAQVIRHDPAAAAQLTVSQLAERSTTSTSAVVRLAKTLGYEGYPQLRLALAAVGGDEGVPVFATDIDADDELSKVLHKLTAFETEGMVATAELADPATMEAVVDALVCARRVLLVGIGASGLVAMDMAQKLTRIGMWCGACTSEDDALVQASLLQPGDAVVAFSHSGETAAIVEAVRRAADASVTTVAVTAGTQSRLANFAASTVLVAGREDGFRSAAMASRMSQLLIVDALYVGVLQRTPSAAKALRRTYEAVADRRTKEVE